MTEGKAMQPTEMPPNPDTVELLKQHLPPYFPSGKCKVACLATIFQGVDSLCLLII